MPEGATPSRGELDPAHADWIRTQYPDFAAMGVFPNLLVPDNTSAVLKACLYEPRPPHPRQRSNYEDAL